jgi:hypothetical protein
MRTIFYGLIIICLASCLSNYIEYTYETEYKIKSIDNNIDTFVDIFTQSSEYGILKQVDSGPYLITVNIGENLDLLNYIEINSILLFVNHTTIDIFEKKFNIYDSSLKRNYNEKEKEVFILDRKINTQFAHSDDYIIILFEDVEIIYNDVSAFELIINVKLNYINSNDVSKEIIYKYSRKRNSSYIIPST